MEKTKILVVDDEKEIADLLEIYLISDGFEVLKAYNGEEGLRILEQEKVDLMLLDVMMPGIDGLEMCRRIKIYRLLLSVPKARNWIRFWGFPPVRMIMYPSLLIRWN